MASKGSVSSLFAALASTLEGDIDQSAQAREKASTDGSYLSIPPQAVVYPKTSDDIRKVILFAKEKRLPLSVRGNGKSTSGGSLSEGIQIDLSRYFYGVLRADIKNNTATIASGTIVENVVERLEKVGVYCPLLSIDSYAKTVGGLASENVTTSSSLTHGDTRLWIEGLTIMLDNGEEHRVEEGYPISGRLLEIYTNLAPYLNHESGNIQASKNKLSHSTSGYDIWNQSIGQKQLLDIIIGSEGTLGVITSVTLRVIPLCNQSYSLFCGVSSLTDLAKAKDVYQLHAADSLYVFDTSLLSLADLTTRHNVPEHIRKSTSRFVLSGIFIRKQNEMAHHAVKMCGEKLSKISKEIFVEIGSSSVTKTLESIHAICNLHLTRTGELSLIPTLDAVSVPKERYISCGEELASIIVSYGYTYFVGPLGSRDHCSLLFFADTASTSGRRMLGECLAQTTKCIHAHDGSMTGGNGDGLIRTPYMTASSDQHMLAVFRYIQRLFDPEQVFNTGKKTFITNAEVANFFTPALYD